MLGDTQGCRGLSRLLGLDPSIFPAHMQGSPGMLLGRTAAQPEGVQGPARPCAPRTHLMLFLCSVSSVALVVSELAFLSRF